MKRIYHLSTCSTCQRILKELPITEEVELVDIKKQNIDEATLDLLAKQVGSYESLFSKRAVKFKELKGQDLTEADYKRLLLEEYTFLKRPFILVDGACTIGNSKEQIAKAIALFKK